MSHHTSFDRRANERIARRERARSERCEECGGRWWAKARRIWHRFDCSRNPTFARRSQSPAEQDAERKVLSEDYDPSCEHGFDNWLACPRCSQDADEAEHMGTAEEYDRATEAQWEMRRNEVGP